MTITGFISPWNKNAGAEIRKNFAELETKYNTIYIDLVNCYGGSIFEGWPTYNAIHNSSKKVITRAEGLVASMGSILFLAPPKKENRQVAKGSRIMVHKASGGAVGDYEHLIEQAEVMKDMEGELIDVVAEASGKDVETVKAEWFKRGVDKYFNPNQAVDVGFAGSIIKSKKLKTEPPKDVLNNADPETLANYYTAQFNESSTENQNINKKMEKLPLFIAALTSAGVEVSNEASETEILNKVQEVSQQLVAANAKVEALETENKGLKDDAKTQKEAAVKTLIDNAVKDGRIKEEQRESMTNYANSDLAGATEFINGLAPIKSFSGDQSRKTPENKEDQEQDDLSNRTFNEWRKLDPKGLAKIKNEDPDRYQELYENRNKK